VKIIQVVNYPLRICPEGVTHLDKKLLQKPNSDFGDSNFLDKGYTAKLLETPHVVFVYSRLRIIV